jgi:hypothetical protein
MSKDTRMIYQLKWEKEFHDRAKSTAAILGYKTMGDFIRKVIEQAIEKAKR